MPSLYTSIQGSLFNGDIWGQSGAWPNKTTDTEVLGLCGFGIGVAQFLNHFTGDGYDSTTF